MNDLIIVLVLSMVSMERPLFAMPAMEQAASLAPAAFQVPAPGTPKYSQDAQDLLNDAYHMDFSGNSDGGAARGELILKRVNNPSGYSMTGNGGSLTRTASPGRVEYRSGSGLLAEVVARPGGEDYFVPGGAEYSRDITPDKDIFMERGVELFSRTAVDSETLDISCVSGGGCLVQKIRPWGDEFLADGRLVLLRAACPGGDVFYGEGGARLLVRVAGPGGDEYYRPAGAPPLPDIAQLLGLKENLEAWRAVLFEVKRGVNNRRAFWPVPAPLYE